MKYKKKKSNNIGMIIRALILVVILIIFTICLLIRSVKIRKENERKENDFNSIIKQYLVENDEKEYKDKCLSDNSSSDFKTFVDYKIIGQDSDNDVKYVYVWALVQNYFVQNNEYVRSGCGSATSYKFTIKNKEIINVEKPEEGSNYLESMKKIFPEDKIDELNSLDDNQDFSNDICNQAKEYYKEKYDENNLYNV